jgi:hypothetical protein
MQLHFGLELMMLVKLERQLPLVFQFRFQSLKLQAFLFVILQLKLQRFLFVKLHQRFLFVKLQRWFLFHFLLPLCLHFWWH